ncbi:DUF2164 domain-containing protein [Microbulbifer sp. 2304DJ12-6]|uniref:DUF2164 domain-containing protein n=1 Tax=Microbulbifer sp. 2304DJ12-6 TaxID=3233340 RepID=UPI0039AECE2A
MTKIQFSKEEKTLITTRIQMYFREELDQEIGNFDAEFLLDFFSEEMGAYFYNRGLYDAQHLLNTKVEEIEYLVQDLEKPTEFRK